jgi:5-methylcytosine-specific restriction protein A
MALKDLTREAVISAIAEYDVLGRDAFLSKYGFSDAKRYWLVWNGQQYPSKAIAGVAHRYIDGQPILGSTAFTGGDASVGKRLQNLGFDLHVVPANPDWSRDEIILALDLYFANSASIPSKESEQVKNLSSLLNAMHVAMGTTAGTTIRNVNGVYLKLMNLRALDPAYLAQGKVGMQAGGKLEKTVWAEYVDHREKLASDAAAIRSAITALTWPTSDAEDGLPGYEGDEGGVVIRLHKRYERDRRLIAEKKKAAKAARPLACEACGFDFAASYGELGADFIEVHHKHPVHLMKAKSKTHLNDLALLCANCHRMAHRKRIPLTVDELKAAISQSLA